MALPPFSTVNPSFDSGSNIWRTLALIRTTGTDRAGVKFARSSREQRIISNDHFVTVVAGVFSKLVDRDVSSVH
jgi:hypothetical protein